MGYLAALDFKQYLDLDSVLEWHLQGNCYPPLPLSLIPTCKRAIELANYEEWDELVPLVGIQHRTYGNSVPVHEVVRVFHLEAFLEEDFFEEEELDEEEEGVEAEDLEEEG